MELGSRLRQAREDSGKSVHEIAQVTKISAVAIDALEREEFSRLPGGIFARAFVRSYAAEVGLDPDATVAEFLRRYPPAAPECIEDEAGDAPPIGALRWIALAGALVLLAAGAAAYFWATRSS